MHGELLLETQTWKSTLPATLISFAVSAAVLVAAMRYLSMQGWQQAAIGAIAAYLLYRVLYPAIASALPKGGTRVLRWEVTPDILVLDNEIIPRNTIRQVYCWPNRDALGHPMTGWTVNVEMSGRNELFRSFTRGEQVEQSAQALRALVCALGYETRWQE